MESSGAVSWSRATADRFGWRTPIWGTLGLPLAILLALFGDLLVAPRVSAEGRLQQPTTPPVVESLGFPGFEPMYGPYPPDGPPWGSVVTLPDEMPHLLPPAYDASAYPQREIKDFKEGFFQKASITATWLDRGDLDDIGITELETFFTVAVPAPTREMPLLISPGFGVRFLDGPGGPGVPNLPSRLYDITTEFRWLTMVNPRFGLELAIIPGIYIDDFDDWNNDAFRLKVRVGTLYKCSDEVSIVLGATYLDRDDISVLPIAGIIYTPHEDWRYELVFPRAKIARRFACGPDWEDWLYLAGEFGGDQYAYEPVPGTRNDLVYRDVRIRVGVERKRDGGGGRRIEIGYVFDREFEFDSAIPDYKPDNTVMIRAGVAY